MDPSAWMRVREEQRFGRTEHSLYALFAAQNFLSSISRDGSHNDTALCIFDYPGLKGITSAAEEEATVEIAKAKPPDIANAEGTVSSPRSRSRFGSSGSQSSCCRYKSTQSLPLPLKKRSLPTLGVLPESRLRRRVLTADSTEALSNDFARERSSECSLRAQSSVKKCESTSIRRDFLSERRPFLTRFRKISSRDRDDSSSCVQIDADEVELSYEEKAPQVSTCGQLTFLKRWRTHTGNGRFYLSTYDTSIPLLAFTHIPFVRHRTDAHRTSSEERDRHISTTLADVGIRPIDFKENEEVSFERLFSVEDAYENLSGLPERSPAFPRKRSSAVRSNIFLPSKSDKGLDISEARCSSFQSNIDRNIAEDELDWDVTGGKLEKEPKNDADVGGTVQSACHFEFPACADDYDPNLIAFFETENAFRKISLKFSGYVSTLLSFASEEEKKRLLNEKFRSHYPHVHVSYTKIKSIKLEMLRIAECCDLDDVVVAHAYVFYERVVLKGMVDKANRKLVAGAALLVAAKITDFGSLRLPNVVDRIETSFRVSRKELLQLEIPLCVALDFNLQVPEYQLLPHFQRISFSKF